jgi:hypothetical protein
MTRGNLKLTNAPHSAKAELHTLPDHLHILQLSSIRPYHLV